MDISVIFDGRALLETKLERIERGIAYPTRLYQSLAEFMADRTAERFQRGGYPDRWADIKPQSRLQRKASRTTPPLWDVAELYKAATATRPGVAHSLFALLPDGFTMGTDRADAARHQFGFKGRDSRGRNVNEPARPFEMITDSDEVGMKSLTETYIDSLI